MNGAMIAFLPAEAEWCKQDLPHMTLVYAGTTDQLQPGDFNALAKDAAMLGMLFRPFSLRVVEKAVFGDEEKVDVLRLRSTPELLSARRAVERWNASQHPFNPHVTIGPAGAPSFHRYEGDSFIPGSVYFNKIMVGWGDESLTFNLNHNY